MVTVHYCYGVFDAAGLLHEINNLLHTLVVAVVVFNVVNNAALGHPISLPKSVYQWQGHFLFLDIDTNRLADFSCSVIKKVILYLESNTYFLTKQTGFLYFFFRCSR